MILSLYIKKTHPICKLKVTKNKRSARFFRRQPKTAAVRLELHAELSGLPLDTAGGIALCQIFHFGNSHQIEIVLDGVLQAGRRHSKIDGILIVLARDQAVNAASTCSCNSCDAFCLRSRFIRLRIRCVVFLQVPLI